MPSLYYFDHHVAIKVTYELQMMRGEIRAAPLAFH